MATKYFINLNFVCNERCIFCAANLANGSRVSGREPMITLEQLREWLGDSPPGQDDCVMLAGGEPTLHRDLLPIVRLLRTTCPEVSIFTNGLRFSSPAFARAALEAGITKVEIGLFGATAAAHEAITRVPGSFEKTLRAMNVLADLKTEFPFSLQVRLLVSRQSNSENPGIVRLIKERAPGVDTISLNRLILSGDAAAVDATISWEQARAAVNEAAWLARSAGLALIYGAIPFCVFDDSNLEFVRADQAELRRQMLAGSRVVRHAMRYLDPIVPDGKTMENQPMGKRVLPAACTQCDFLSTCTRVEDWYVERYGLAGIHSIRRTAPAAAVGG